ADVAVFVHALDLALSNNEFYGKGDVAKANRLVDMCSARLKTFPQTPWRTQKGLVVRGYRSAIDGAVQPYGLEIPADLDFTKPVPLYVWLHGRGDKTTDLHFIDQRASRAGRIAPAGAIVVHPFGRHCIGFKSAGEIDVLDVVKHVQSEYKIDPDRVVLMGFSMGGAGAWHLGAHYTDHWVAVSPGAGFAETAKYNRLALSDYPVTYEQTLWQLYDVPGYVRNLFNVPFVAYSGEVDKQIQAARVMEEAFKSEGRELPHIIGPKMGHSYHPDSLAEIMKMMAVAVDEKRDRSPAKVHLQTKTLRYNRMHWVTALRLERHWQDSRVDAEITSPHQWKVETKNIRELQLNPQQGSGQIEISIDGKLLQVERDSGKPVILSYSESAKKWTEISRQPKDSGLFKVHGLQGPIDDVWMSPFLVVVPSQECRSEKVQRWMEFEIEHMKRRWQTLFRGELRIKKDSDVTPDDIANYHLVVWGDANANSIIAKSLGQLPVQWDVKTLTVNGKEHAAADHVPVFVYPNPLNSKKYIVVNSGPTFREGHDSTNSLQNPKLPDWAVVDLNTLPSAQSPGKIVDAGFFSEAWQYTK
ncbi:MAG: putative esterase, partial [Pirellulaceae bacterium]